MSCDRSLLEPGGRRFRAADRFPPFRRYAPTCWDEAELDDFLEEHDGEGSRVG